MSHSTNNNHIFSNWIRRSLHSFQSLMSIYTHSVRLDRVLCLKQNRDGAWLHSFNCQIQHHTAQLLSEAEISNFPTAKLPQGSRPPPTSVCPHNPELTAIQPSWGGGSEQHRRLGPTKHAPGPRHWLLLHKHHNQKEKRGSLELTSSSLSLCRI